MSTSRDKTIEIQGPEHQLFQLLRDNYYNSLFGNYALGHQERMADINKILASDGGEVTITALIKLIGTMDEKERTKLAEMKAAHAVDKKKHPFRTFFSNDYLRQKYRESQFIACLETIRNELVAATRLKNVIELSRFSKTV